MADYSSITEEEEMVSASDWVKGITLSVLASVVGGASKLAIRKSWLLEKELFPIAETSVDDVHSQCSSNSNSSSNHSSLDDSDHATSLLPRRNSTSGVTDEDTTSILDSSEKSTTRRKKESEQPSFTSETTTTTSTTTIYSPPPSPNGRTSSITIYDPETRRPVCKSVFPMCLRLSGMLGMSVLNPLCCVLAMNYASPSILAPFSGLTLVWIVLLSGYCVDEPPTGIQVVAAALIVSGEVVVAIFGDHTSDEDMTVDDVRASYRNGPFLAYIGVASTWLILVLYWMWKSRSPTIRRFAWGVSSGFLTGFQNFLKDSLTLIKASSKESGQKPYFLIAFMFFMSGFTAFCGLLMLTACMKRYDATYTSTMFVGSYVISASIMSAFHYDTFQHLEEIANLVLYPTGLAILMGGVYLLIMEGERQQHEEPVPRRISPSISRSSSRTSIASPNIGEISIC